MESMLRETFFDVDGIEIDISRCGGGSLRLAVDGYVYDLTATEAARLRDWLNQALGSSGAECEFSPEKVKALYDDMLADIRKLGSGCVCARPDDADEPESDAGPSDEFLKGWDEAKCVFESADDDEPDVDMVQLRIWAVEQTSGDYPLERVVDAGVLVDYVLNGTLPA
jgi:hypothetical protein